MDPMSYIQGSLMDGERLIYQTRLHRIVLARPFLLAAGALGFSFFLGHEFVILLGLAAAVYFAGPTFVKYACSEYGVTNRRLYIKKGWLTRTTVETPLMKVGAIAVSQDLLGRILGYGTIVVKGTGGTNETLHRIDAPLQFRRVVQEQLLADR